VLCGWSEARPGFHFERQAWQTAQVLVSIEGTGEWVDEGEWRSAMPGSALVCPARIPHRYRCSGERWRVAWCILEDRCSPEVVPQAHPRVVTCDQLQLKAAIEGCYREGLGAADPQVLGHWAGLVRALCVRIARNGQSASRLAPVWAAVDAALAHPWTLAELPGLAGVGEEQLRRLCRKDLDRSPMAQVAWLRMRRAEALLATGLSVAATSERVGYADGFTFSAAFKRIVGMPPSQVVRIDLGRGRLEA
jgi:AraC-like DNA-binding protein